MHLSDPKELPNSLRASQKIILGSLATGLRSESRVRVATSVYFACHPPYFN